jgi:hypothetical protein
LAALVAMAAASAGCAPAVASVGPQNPEPAAPGTVAGPFVQAGTLFSVQADEPLDTYYGSPGMPFTATVVDPLFGQDGRLIVAYGAKVRGTIVSVGPYETPRLRFALQSIDTTAGTVPLQAAVRRAQHYQWAGPDPLDLNASTSPSGAYARGSGQRQLPPADSFAYQDEYGYGTQQPREVRVPRGAILELALVKPLALPAPAR